MRFSRLAAGVLLAGAIAGAWTAAGSGMKEKHTVPTTEASDPYLWLEDIHGAKSMDWVKAQNAKSRGILEADADYQKNFDAVLKVLDATDRIPYGAIDHG